MPEDRTDSSDLKADLKGARWALDYLLFEDSQSKNLSVHGAMCLDLIRRYIEDQETAARKLSQEVLDLGA